MQPAAGLVWTPLDGRVEPMVWPRPGVLGERLVLLPVSSVC